MRRLALIAVLVLAACGGGGGGDAESNEAAAAAAGPSPGQWELASEVTTFTTLDEGAPKILATVGDRASESLCVGEGDRLPAAFFAGEGYECSYGTYYVRNGRVNVTLDCRREGLDGMIVISAEGQSQAETAEFTRSIRTALSTDGDVELSSRITARRTGECAPEPVDGNRSEANAAG